MSRRHSTNPAKLKADLASLAAEESAAPATSSMWQRRRVLVLLSLLSAVLLLASFPPFDHWYLAYVALVPLTATAVLGRRARWALAAAYVGGVAFWAAGVYWLTWITLIGYVAAVLYLGVYWLVAAWFVRRAYARGWPMWLCLPTVWVALEYARAFVVTGFPWFNLAMSQYSRLALIQVADLFGQYGLSFLIAMINGALVDALAWMVQRRAAADAAPKSAVATPPPRPLWKAVVLPVSVSLAATSAVLGYGQWRLMQSAHREGPRVGVSQMAYPVSLVHRSAPAQEVFDSYVANTRPLAAEGCDLVVIPESMLSYSRMDPDFWLKKNPDDPAQEWSPEQRDWIRRYHGNLQALRGLVADLGCPLLAGGGMPARDPDAQRENMTANSALLYELDERGGLRLTQRYDKMHLVPFGEYVPFREDWPWLHKLLRSFVPESMPQLEPGRRIERFEVRLRSRDQAGSQVARFAVPICYEGTFDRVCRSMVVTDGRKAVDLLVNISNDGWFINPTAGGPVASTELEQHLAQYVFRAVENRVPVVRAVNVGISGHIDSCGRIVDVVQQGGRRTMVAGRLVAHTLVDERVSLYSRIGNAFAAAVSLAAVVAAYLVRRRIKGTDA